MSKIKILDAELELDMMDAEDNSRVVAAISAVASSAQEGATDIHDVCKMVNDCFDKIFGEEATKKVFGGKENLRDAVTAYASLVDEANKQQEQFEDLTMKLKAKYSPQRAAREI